MHIFNQVFVELNSASLKFFITLIIWTICSLVNNRWWKNMPDFNKASGRTSRTFTPQHFSFCCWKPNSLKAPPHTPPLLHTYTHSTLTSDWPRACHRGVSEPIRGQYLCVRRKLNSEDIHLNDKSNKPQSLKLCENYQQTEMLKMHQQLNVPQCANRKQLLNKWR